MTTNVSAGTTFVAGNQSVSTSSATTLPENNTEFRLDYIKDGEPLSGYKSENDVGVLNRTQYQLFSLIEFLKLEIQKIKNIETSTTNSELTEANNESIQEVENQMALLTRVLGQKVSDQDSKIKQIEKTVDTMLKQKPTNFLDYQMVRQLEQLVLSLEAKVFDLDNRIKNNQTEIVESGISEEQLNPIKSQLTLLDARVRNLIDEIGIYDSENNSGSGLKNRVHQLYQLATRTKEILDLSVEGLSPQQEVKVQDIVETLIFSYKVKVNQNDSIAREINARISHQERAMSKFIEKNQISDELLGEQTLTDIITETKNNAQNALQKAQNALDQSNQQVTKVDDLESSVDDLRNELTLITQKAQQLGQSYSTLSEVIGHPNQENTILGTLTEIDTLKSEFSENIQNINMIIGSNVPGHETGFYRLLNDAKVNRNPYYTIRISEEQSQFNKIKIKLPEYVQSKGNSFIIRNKGNLETLQSQYDINKKELLIDIANLSSEFDLLILPIQTEIIQINSENITGENE